MDQTSKKNKRNQNVNFLAKYTSAHSVRHTYEVLKNIFALDML